MATLQNRGNRLPLFAVLFFSGLPLILRQPLLIEHREQSLMSMIRDYPVCG